MSRGSLASPRPCRVRYVLMNTPSPLPQEMWDQLPAVVQAYIRALEARIAALEATVQHLTERLQPRPNGHVACPVAGSPVDNPAIQDKHERLCPSPTWMSSFPSSPRSVPAAGSRCSGAIRSRTGIR